MGGYSECRTRKYSAMRVIAGKYRSRPLRPLRGMDIRPTSDRLRETLFNVLAPRIEGASFLDLYAGSGAVGIEALSRGAARAVLVEDAPAPLAAMRANLANLGLRENVRILAGSVSAYLRRMRLGTPHVFDVIFLDPPWDAANEYESTLGLLGGGSAPLLAPGALVIAEHRCKQQLEDRCGRLRRTRLLEQGDAALSFYALESEGQLE